MKWDKAKEFLQQNSGKPESHKGREKGRENEAEVFETTTGL